MEENLRDDALKLILELCDIPAPQDGERARAEYCNKWLRSFCGQSYIDEANNAVCPVNDTGGDCVLMIAHTDTVFPDTAPYPVSTKSGRMYCPGIGDDTAELAVMLLCARYAAAHKYKNLIFAADSGEEGLGNLKGMRRLYERYGHRLKAVVSLDCGLGTIVTQAVGSLRYRVTAKTIGGHSYSDFGTSNAIEAMAELIAELYSFVPPKGTTYNVGKIQGGTSVNTVAADASMLFEYRSDSIEELERCRGHFAQVIAAHHKAAHFEARLLGERPCGLNKVQREDELADICAKAVGEATGKSCSLSKGSTDANIPLFHGIPAIAMGTVVKGGAHTREDWIEPDSLTAAVRIGMNLTDALSKF